MPVDQLAVAVNRFGQRVRLRVRLVQLVKRLSLKVQGVIVHLAIGLVIEVLLVGCQRVTQLVDAILAPGLAGLSRATVATLVDGSSAQTRTAFQVLLGKLDAQAATSIERITQLTHTLEGGDRVRGREVFHGRLAACSACHRVEGKGGWLGPNLSHIGAVRTRRDWLESIVRETADTLYLRTLDRAEIRVARDEIEDLAPGTVSTMPKGLDLVISQDQIRDLLAYLASLGKDAR